MFTNNINVLCGCEVWEKKKDLLPFLPRFLPEANPAYFVVVVEEPSPLEDDEAQHARISALSR